MQTPDLLQIEKDIQQLPLSERLLLIEQLARQLRKELANSISYDLQLSAMALDPSIQREIREIDAEFATTEQDGLGVV